MVAETRWSPRQSTLLFTILFSSGSSGWWRRRWSPRQSTLFLLFCLALAALAGGGGGGGGCRNQVVAQSHQTHEMTVPNEIIGCVIGKGGSKIAEIRYRHRNIFDTAHLKFSFSSQKRGWGGEVTPCPQLKQFFFLK